ncbi:MAG TPA: lipopolysaccharide assembly protein LapA domain-containing protein [Actinomycetota bacterium]|nr:lipopolysaccharide assembly protein LapA domain-containing protein [Actinomycetota bacterium]
MRRDPDQSDDAEGLPEEKPRFEYRREWPSGKAIALVIATILLVIFVLQNLDHSDIDFLFWDADVAIALAIVIAAVLGFVIGWAFGRMRRRAKDAD